MLPDVNFELHPLVIPIPIESDGHANRQQLEQTLQFMKALLKLRAVLRNGQLCSLL